MEKLPVLICTLLIAYTERSQDGVKFTGWNTLNLKGEVARMTTSEGNDYRFDRRGNILEAFLYDASWTDDLHYVQRELLPMVVEFSVDDQEDDFGFLREHRIERVDPDSGFYWPDEFTYTFDHHGRILIYYSVTADERINRIYHYADDDSPFPCAMDVWGYSEGGGWEAAYGFVYLEFDARGNWTRRRVIRLEDVFGDEYGLFDEPQRTETEYTETAEYTYW